MRSKLTKLVELDGEARGSGGTGTFGRRGPNEDFLGCSGMHIAFEGGGGVELLYTNTRSTEVIVQCLRRWSRAWCGKPLPSTWEVRRS